MLQVSEKQAPSVTAFFKQACCHGKTQDTPDDIGNLSKNLRTARCFAPPAQETTVSASTNTARPHLCV
jgi:hypothetical protein